MNFKAAKKAILILLILSFITSVSTSVYRDYQEKQQQTSIEEQEKTTD